MKASRILISALFILLAGRAVWLETGAQPLFANRAPKEEAAPIVQKAPVLEPVEPKMSEPESAPVVSKASPAPEARQIGSIRISSVQRSGGRTTIKNGYMHRVPTTPPLKTENFMGFDITEKSEKK
jgi:hypothetical protein